MDTNLILAIAQVVSVAFIPLIVWFIGVKHQDRKSKKEAQLRLFLILMANRQKTPISQEWVDALNSIDVVFQDNKRVRHAWRDYLDSLNQKSAHFDNQNSYKLDLLSEMAEALGYKQLKQTEIDRFYSPMYFSSQQSRQEILYNETLRVLMRSKSEAETLSDEDYKIRKKRILGDEDPFLEWTPQLDLEQAPVKEREEEEK